MTTTPSLPAELIGIIATHMLEEVMLWPSEEESRLRSDRVRQLAVVSRTWLHPCRTRLFSTLSLGSGGSGGRSWDIPGLQLARFAFIAARPHLAAYVTRLAVGIGYEEQSDIDAILLVAPVIHRLFLNVASIQFYDERLPYMSADEIDRFISGFTLLRHLDLDINTALYSELLEKALFCELLLVSVRVWADPDSGFLTLLRVLAKSPCADTLQKLTLECSHDALERLGRLSSDWLQIASWKEIKLRCRGALSGVNGENAVCIGTHPLLTSLTLDISAHRTPAYLLRSLIFAAHLPALKKLSIGLNFNSSDRLLVDNTRRTSSIVIPIPQDAGSILSSAMASKLESLTFHLDYSGHMGTCLVVNWADFLRLFPVSPERTSVRYDGLTDNLRLATSARLD